MLRRAEDVLGLPVEIEWAMDDDGFTMLQARPLHLQAPHVPDDIWLQHPRLNGHPAGIGWGAGRAVVINCECEIGRIAPGDVLVTRVAGPALGHILSRVSASSPNAEAARPHGFARARARNPDGARGRRRHTTHSGRRPGRGRRRGRDSALDLLTGIAWRRVFRPAVKTGGLIKAVLKTRFLKQKTLSGLVMSFIEILAAPLMAAAIAASSSQAPVTDRIIEEDIRVRLPLLPCTVPQAAVRIAESLPAPLGLELVPEPCGEKGKSLPTSRTRSC